MDVDEETRKVARLRHMQSALSPAKQSGEELLPPPPPPADVPVGQEDMEAVDKDTPIWARNLKKDFLSGVRSIVKEEIQVLQNDVGTLKTKVQEIDGKADEALGLAREAKQATEILESKMTLMKGVPKEEISACVAQTIKDRIGDIENKIGKSKNKPATNSDTNQKRKHKHASNHISN